MEEREFDQMHVRIKKTLKKLVEMAADQEERSMNSWIVIAIKEKLNRDQTQQNPN